jgi:hypothetical protein
MTLSSRNLLSLAIAAVVVASGNSALADSIDHTADATWESLLREAASKGYKFKRNCFPREQRPYCTLTMTSAPTNGKAIVLMEAYDAQDQLMGRSICANNVGAAMTRHCVYVDAKVETDEMFDTSKEEWYTLSWRVAAAPLASAPDAGPTYTALKEWDTATSGGTSIHQTLYAASDGSMRLLATEHDSNGNQITSSTCNFNQNGWSDCINEAGVHYQLKPNSIAYFYSLRSPMTDAAN